MNLTQLFSLVAIAGSLGVHANEYPQIDWKLSQDGLRDALALIPKDKSHSAMAQLLRETKFNVRADVVRKEQTLVNYFPRFVDVESHGTMGLYFDPNYEKVIIKAAASVSPNGVIKQIDPSQIQVLGIGVYNTFSSQKEIALAIPGLEEGGIAVLKYEIITQRSMMEHDWAEELHTQRSYPMDSFRLDVVWDEASPVYWANDSEDVNCKQTNSTLSCLGHNIAAFDGDYQVKWRDAISRIALGSMRTWQDVADRASTTMNTAFRDQSGLEPLFQTLTHGAIDTDEKIKRILSFVSRDIRYVSRSKFGHAMTPHDLAETIENRLGDCKDKSVLLLGLLNKLGLDAELVLVATKQIKTEGVLLPTMTAFNHVVVCFEYGEQRYCVDPTDTQTNWQYTPEWIQSKVSLPLTQDAQLGQMQQSRYRWKMNTDTVILFDDLGGQKEVQERVYVGEYAGLVRANLYELGEAERIEKLTDEYSEVVTSIGNPEFQVKNLDTMSTRTVVRSESVIEPFLGVEEELQYEEHDAWIKKELVDLKMYNEKYPALFHGVRVVSDVYYDTNNLWEITDIPPTLELTHSLGSLTRSAELISPTELSVRTILEVRSTMVEVSERERFNKMLNTFAEQSLIKFYGKVLKQP